MTVFSIIQETRKLAEAGEMSKAINFLKRESISYDLCPSVFDNFFDDKGMTRFFNDVDLDVHTWRDVVDSVSQLKDISKDIFYKDGDVFVEVEMPHIEEVLKVFCDLTFIRKFESDLGTLSIYFDSGFYNEYINLLMYYVSELEVDWPIAKCFKHVSKLSEFKKEVDSLILSGVLRPKYLVQDQIQRQRAYQMEWFYYDETCGELRNLTAKEMEWLFTKLQNLFNETKNA